MTTDHGTCMHIDLFTGELESTVSEKIQGSNFTTDMIQ